MFKFKPDPDRENEALWGTKDGFEGALRRNSITVRDHGGSK